VEKKKTAPRNPSSKRLKQKGLKKGEKVKRIFGKPIMKKTKGREEKQTEGEMSLGPKKSWCLFSLAATRWGKKKGRKNKKKRKKAGVFPTEAFWQQRKPKNRVKNSGDQKKKN